MKCNETIGKWCKNKHGASKIIDTFETYQTTHSSRWRQAWRWRRPPVVIPLSGRVPGWASGPSRSSGQRRRWIAMCSGKVIGSLCFSRRGVFIGEGATLGVGRGALTHRGRGQGPGRAALLCVALMAPLRFLFGSLEASVNFWTFGFCFVQFREYFLCNFSET
jgi:hypothetical protein